jgi:diaminopimelate epimerase
MTWSFVKGHGTANDFVILTDGPDPTTEQVARICDRRRGLGADGILRLVPGDVPFMDYRNADGSLAQMCGNGIRVYARWLVDAGHAAPGTWPIQTRGGLRTVTVPADPLADISVGMGQPQRTADLPVTIAGSTRLATGVSMGNPHLVLTLTAEEVRGADLTRPPQPLGHNIELVALTGEREVLMRVHERGSGETASCGTGACAAVVALSGAPTGEPWTVEVPGGRLGVSWGPEGVVLCGPAQLVASGSITL